MFFFLQRHDDSSLLSDFRCAFDHVNVSELHAHLTCLPLHPTLCDEMKSSLKNNKLFFHKRCPCSPLFSSFPKENPTPLMERMAEDHHACTYRLPFPPNDLNKRRRNNNPTRPISPRKNTLQLDYPTDRSDMEAEKLILSTRKKNLQQKKITR